MKPLDLTLCLVTDAGLIGNRTLTDVVRAAVGGGATLVQLRDKKASTRALIDQAARLKAILDPLGVPLIVNDRVDVALAADAAGVHLGQEDMPVATARRLLGPDRIVGATVHDAAEAAEIDAAIVDYVGIGPAYATSTKGDARKALGADGFRRLSRAVPVPVLAIGGISADNAAAVVAAGAAGVAVVAAICAASDPRAAAEGLVGAVRDVRPSPQAQGGSPT